jgi:hydroxymethylpyrimidine pyrophosphatase-like HAD family hydrolase
MLKIKVSIAFILLSIFVSCKLISYKSYAKDFSITFGSGGGFTGEINEYILEGNGNLFSHKSLSNEIIFLKKIEFKHIKQIFKLAESNEIISYNLNETGNMTSFIKINKSDNQLNSISWPSGKTDLDTHLKELNTKLYNLLL